MGSTLDSLIESHKPSNLKSWLSKNDDYNTCWQFEFAHIHLSLRIAHLTANDTYQVSDVAVQDTNHPVRRRDLDPIRQDVRAILGSDSSHRATEASVSVLQALERVAAFEHVATAREKEARRRTRGWDAAQIDTWEEVLANPLGLDVATVADTAHHLLGRTPAELVAGISDEFRVVHMESVVRGDLLARFLAYQRALGENLRRSTGQNLQRCMPPGGGSGRALRREDVIADMIRPRVTFHGTPIRSVRSIVRHGFVKPGRLVDGKVVASPRTGIVYDRGIYSSPSPGYALSYAVGRSAQEQRVATPLGMLPSLRLIVCATVMGRTYSGREGVHGPLVEGFDAHYDGDLEYIAHHEAAMLPCYVIHLDLGSAAARAAVALAQTDPSAYRRQVHAARERRLHPKLAETEAAPGDRKRAAEARKAAAMKWFPYGYGSAQGTRFVVEEVGEVSDDEEDYGEWQEDKHAYMSVDKEGHWLDGEGVDTGAIFAEGTEKGLFLDGYQTARY